MKRVFVSGAAVIGVLGLAACGQGDQGKATAPVEATPAQTVEAPPVQAAPVQAGSGDALAPGTEFNAVGTVSCALAAAQPMRQCEAGVIRNADGTAVVRVKWPDGRSRNLFFDRTGAVGADVSQADGPDAQGFKVEKVEDLYKIALGTKERYEVPEALVVGG